MDKNEFDPDEMQPANIRDRAIPGRQSGRQLKADEVDDDPAVSDAQPPDIVNVSGSSPRGYGERRRARGVPQRGPRPEGARSAAPREYRPPAAAVPEPDAVKPARALLEAILSRMGIPQVEVAYIPRSEGEYLEVRGPDLANLIGRHGHTLEALNLIFNNIVNVGVRNNRHYYTIDAEGYRARRADALKTLALATLERAIREKKPQTLEPMLPSERKIIHLALAENQFVTTESTGVEPERRVVVLPR